MSKTSMIGCVAFAMGSEPPWVHHLPATTDNRAVAVIHFGTPGRLSLHVKDTPPETLRSLAATFTELAQWQEEQLAAKDTAQPGGAP